MKLITDYREVASSIPALLKEKGAEVEIRRLKTGDYILPNKVIVERKTREDLIASLIQGRLFSQCSRMKKSNKHGILIIEGDPYTTIHAIDRRAIMGALLSVTLCWQIPFMISRSKEETAEMLLMACQQFMKTNNYHFSKAKNPKNEHKKAVFFLQGMPAVGPVTAKALLEKFGSVENVILADEEALIEMEGLGKKKVRMIRDFLSKPRTTNKQKE